MFYRCYIFCYMNNFFCVLVFLVLFLGCQSKNSVQSTEQIAFDERIFPEQVTSIFDAHGGYVHWSIMQTLKFDLSKGEKYQVDLTSRNVNIASEDWIIGSKGGSVWITPDTVKFSDPRFYHSLYYYFVTMPFILGDPGITYGIVEDKVFRDTTYSAVKISFADGVGDAPKDNYFICYDKKTKVMKWLMYTVTYGDNEANNDYGLINYADWKEVNGLLMPSRLVWYKYNDGINITRRSDVAVLNWFLSKEALDYSLFSIPEEARLAE